MTKYIYKIKTSSLVFKGKALINNFPLWSYAIFSLRVVKRKRHLINWTNIGERSVVIPGKTKIKGNLRKLHCFV